MAILATLVVIAIILITSLIFFEEISSGFNSFVSGQSEQGFAGDVDFQPVQGSPTCDLAITFFGEIEHELFSLPAISRFEFGDNTSHPEIAEWQFVNCQATSAQIASFLPRLPTNIKIFQEETTDFEITPDQLAQLNLSPSDIAQLNVINIFDQEFEMQLKVKSAGQQFQFRQCGTFQQGLCKTILLPSGLIPEPFTFQKTFLIKSLPLQDYDIEVVIAGERINDLETNQPFIYNVRF